MQRAICLRAERNLQTVQRPCRGIEKDAQGCCPTAVSIGLDTKVFFVAWLPNNRSRNHLDGSREAQT